MIGADSEEMEDEEEDSRQQQSELPSKLPRILARLIDDDRQQRQPRGKKTLNGWTVSGEVRLRTDRQIDLRTDPRTDPRTKKSQTPGEPLSWLQDPPS